MHVDVSNRPPAEHGVGGWQRQRSLTWRVMSGNEGHISEDPAIEAYNICWLWDFRHHFTDTEPRNQTHTHTQKARQGGQPGWPRASFLQVTLSLFQTNVLLLPHSPSLGHFSPLPLFPLPSQSFFLSSPSHPLNPLLHTRTHSHTLLSRLTGCCLRKVETSNSEVYQPRNNVQGAVL